MGLGFGVHALAGSALRNIYPMAGLCWGWGECGGGVRDLWLRLGE